MVAFEAGLLALGALLISGPRIGAPDHHHGIMLGAASGVLFGVSGVAMKAITGLGHDGIAACSRRRGSASRAIGSVVAFFAKARGMQQGEAVPVIAATSTAANVSGIAGGIIVFGDPMPGDALGIAVQVLAFGLVVVAAPARRRAPGARGSPSGRGAVAAIRPRARRRPDRPRAGRQARRGSPRCSLGPRGRGRRLAPAAVEPPTRRTEEHQA